MTNPLNHFATEAAALAYIKDELIATLQDDLERMEGREAQHYGDDERQEMRNRISDLESIMPRLVLRMTEGPEEGRKLEWGTQVSLIFGASAYAVITECGVRFDVRLSPGRLAATSLREYAAEQRARADCLIESAERAERAAVVLDQAKADKRGRTL